MASGGYDGRDQYVESTQREMEDISRQCARLVRHKMFYQQV